MIKGWKKSLRMLASSFFGPTCGRKHRIAALLSLSVVAAGCSEPYSTPQLSAAWPPNGSTQFTGLLGLATPNEKIVWTHGVCPTDFAWVQNRDALIRAALGPATTVTDNGLFKSYPVGGVPDRLLVYNRLYSIGSKNLSIYFVIWSNMMDDNRNALSYDWNNQYTHASLNLSLKQFFDQCLVDAVAYDGAKGEMVRNVIQTALKDIVAVPFAGDYNDGFTVVTESLGSKIMFDSIAELDENLPKAIAKVNSFFMIANQIPLEDQASDTSVGIAGIAKSLPSSENMTIHRMLKLMRRIRKEHYGEPGVPGENDIFTIVAFSDPNDLLSQDLNSNFVSDDATHIINVTVSNADTYFGYLELPNLAHCGYGGNQKVINMVITSDPNAGQVVPNSALSLACSASDSLRRAQGL
jgi:hypothetical protein